MESAMGIPFGGSFAAFGARFSQTAPKHFLDQLRRLTYNLNRIRSRRALPAQSSANEERSFRGGST
jgi:hypothetical protein